jgi:hypothetical protein
MSEFAELRFKIVRVESAGHEVLARLSNLMVARAAFGISVSLWPSAWIELRQEAHVIEKHARVDRWTRVPPIDKSTANERKKRKSKG